MTGYELYNWTEMRAPGLVFGSSIAKDMDAFQNVIDHVVVARDGYGDWGYSAIVGDGLIARLTPLTLSTTDFNGVRFDLSSPWLKFTFMGSRIAKPTDRTGGSFDGSVISRGTNLNFRADASVLLLGGRVQADIGNLSLGLNGANVHRFHSTRDGGSNLKGAVHPEQPLLDWVVVRFSDDSPRDGRGGPVVQEIQLILDGEERTDLRPGWSATWLIRPRKWGPRHCARASFARFSTRGLEPIAAAAMAVPLRHSIAAASRFRPMLTISTGSTTRRGWT